MPLLPASSGREIAWKNGGGFTREIAAYPPGAGYDVFDWRVSLARIARDGPFSAFPGVDRLFAVVGGGRVRLLFEGAPPLRLEPGSKPVPFTGESRVSAQLVEGEVVALNVMTRRATARAVMFIDDLTTRSTLLTEGGVKLWVALEGAATVETPQGRLAFLPGDAWLSAIGSESVSLRPNDRLRLARIVIY